MPIHITATGSAEDVRQLAEAVRGAGPVTITLDPEPTLTATTEICPLCRMPYDPELACTHKGIEEPICNLCESAALAIEERFRSDARRHFRDFTNNLPQMVRDVRAGLEQPTFYRGWE